jgi:hypothetical protein
MASNQYGPPGIWEGQQYQNPLRSATDQAVRSVQDTYNAPEYQADRQAARRDVTDSNDYNVMLRDARRNEVSPYEQRQTMKNLAREIRSADGASGFYDRMGAVAEMKALRSMYADQDRNSSGAAGDIYSKVAQAMQARNNTLLPLHDAQAARVQGLENTGLSATSYQRNYDQLQSPLAFDNIMAARQQDMRDRAQAMQERQQTAQAKGLYGDELAEWVYGGGQPGGPQGGVQSPLGIPKLGGAIGAQLAVQEKELADKQRESDKMSWYMQRSDEELSELVANGSPNEQRAALRAMYQRKLRNAATQAFDNPLDQANIDVPPTQIQSPQGFGQHAGDVALKAFGQLYNPWAGMFGLPRAPGWGQVRAWDPEGRAFYVDDSYLDALRRHEDKFGPQNTPETRIYDSTMFSRPTLRGTVGSLDGTMLHPLQRNLFE